MEVAGRWRQQWSGAAEYGKVVDGVGGVTRMARALEVMHTSGPGARTRLTRSTFHAQGPLSSSYVFHSSKRTILSSRAGADELVSPHLVWRPQEVSSTPLDAASDSCPEGDEPYKVTEPDDNDISEPSKWRTSRVASEESSSVDTASLVDAGPRVPIPSKRTDSNKTSSTSSLSVRDDEPKIRRPSFRRKPTSEPLMKIAEHARCLQSSKSQTNKTTDEWHDRRNSYGFESSAYSGLKTLTENDKMGMESSTDSGISKSTEVINIPIKNHPSQDSRHLNGTDSRAEDSPGSFKDWLIKNRSLSAFKADFSSIGRNLSDSNNGSINLKSLGKISISLPKYDSSDDDRKRSYEVSDKKQKKVGFCKTELHFAAESGVVNIIETDEKPPPKQDFRRRRSAFYPIRNKIERPITLFGASYSSESISTDAEQTYFGDDDNVQSLERLDNDNDNDTTVKSILKNKIPKPKPYLLGEDTEFDKGIDSKDNIWGVQLRRTSDEYASGNLIKSPISILNESLKQDNRITSKYIQDDNTLNKNADLNARNNLTSQEYKSSPVDYVNLYDLHKELKSEKIVASTQTPEEFIYEKIKTNYRDQNMQTELEEDKPHNESSTNFVHEKLKLLQLSPVLQNRARTRHLRQNELSYFGVTTDSTKDQSKASTNLLGEKTVKPLKRKSKSFGQPLYQNIPILPIPAPMPAPRSKVESNNNAFEEICSNDESIVSDLSEIDEKALTSSNRTRVLEPINEAKASPQDSRKKILTEEKHKNIESKRKSRSGSSPVCTNIETLSRVTRKKTNSKESLMHSRESSVEDVRPVPIMTRRHSRNDKEKNKPSNIERELIRRSDKSISEIERHTERTQKPCTHLIPIDVSEYTRKTRIRSSSVDSKDTSLKRNHTGDRNKTNKENNQQRLHSQTREKHSRHGSKENIDSTLKVKARSSSVDSRDKNHERNSSVERSYRNKGNGHHIHLHSREKHPVIIEEPQYDKSSKRKSSHYTPSVDRIKEKPRKREYVINYDEKNGTCSSGHSKHDNNKRDKTKYGVTKTESKPKQTTTSSRVTTLEVKNPLMSAKDSHQTKKIDHRSPRRKQKEESPQ